MLENKTREELVEYAMHGDIICTVLLLTIIILVWYLNSRSRGGYILYRFCRDTCGYCRRSAEDWEKVKATVGK